MTALAIRVTLRLPPRELSPNARPHWATKQRAVREYRTHAWAEASAIAPAGQRPRWERAELRWTWYVPDARRRDPDNLIASAKSGIDGLRDAGVIADDSGLVIYSPEIRVDRQRPRIEIEIAEVGAQKS